MSRSATPPEPVTPVSPLTPNTISGSTVVGDNDEKQDVENQCSHPSSTEAIERQIDVESQDTPPKRPSVFTSLRRLSSGISDRLPPHWRAGFLNEKRIPQRIDDHPAGFPRFAAFMDSDENFLIARRYGLLHSRVMLYRQSELHELESALERLDKEDEESDEQALSDRKFFDRGQRGQDRKDLINEIDEKLKQYDDCVVRAREMASLPRASKRNYCSVYNYIHTNAPLSTREQDAFMADRDFVALVDPEEAVSLDSLTEDFLSMLNFRWLRMIFSTPEQRASSSDDRLFLYSKARINAFVRIVITVLAVALLMAPVVILFLKKDSGLAKILIVLFFTLFFSLALSLFTRARRAEVFAATAA